jgi:hypothetical protein
MPSGQETSAGVQTHWITAFPAYLVSTHHPVPVNPSLLIFPTPPSHIPAKTQKQI